jgi:hypothetical protein
MKENLVLPPIVCIKYKNEPCHIVDLQALIFHPLVLQHWRSFRTTTQQRTKRAFLFASSIICPICAKQSKARLISYQYDVVVDEKITRWRYVTTKASLKYKRVYYCSVLSLVMIEVRKERLILYSLNVILYSLDVIFYNKNIGVEALQIYLISSSPGFSEPY